MNRQSRTLVVVCASLLLAAIASFALYRVVQHLPVRQVEVASTTVVVAAQEIPVGTVLDAKDLRTVAWPSRNPVPGAVSDPAMLIGRGVIEPIGEHEPITMTKVADPSAGGGLPPIIPAGLRAISVRVNEVIGVAGFVVPGTRVDVVVTVDKDQAGRDPMTRTVVSNVQVLTAGSRFDQEKAKKDGKPIQTSVVTLMVLPGDAEKIALAQNEGKLTLVLRNPLDVAPTETRGVRLASLMSTPDEQPVIDRVQHKVVIKKAAPPASVPTTYTVETYRGAKRSEQEVER
jgi:pilus assembly protein CpaB